MRIAAPLVLISAMALAGAAVTGLSVGHASETKPAATDGKLSKAERKRIEQETIRRAVQRGELLPLPRVLAIAQARVPGDVIKVELESEPAGIKYEVRILTSSGRVREVEINARTGSVIKIEDD